MSLRWLIVAVVLLLPGCALLDTSRGRILLLVFLPAAIVMALLWFMRGSSGGPKGPVYPDNGEDDR